VQGNQIAHPDKINPAICKSDTARQMGVGRIYVVGVLEDKQSMALLILSTTGTPKQASKTTYIDTSAINYINVVSLK